MLLASSGVSGSSSKTYIDDLFSAQLRTGTGSTTSITTGFQPDLIWTKSRSATTGHRLVDSVRGAGNSLESNSTLQQQSEATGIIAFSSSGYSVGAGSDYNSSGAAYVDWCWKKAPKFFDVVTYTGNGTTQNIAHSLGVAPGMVVVKNTQDITSWKVWHRGLSGGYSINLNDANIANNAVQTTMFGNNTTYVDPTSSVFTVGSNGNVNSNGQTYVAYLFAHDPSADGIIQCGSFTTDASGNATVNTIGWEPQWGMFKASSGTGDWIMLDQMRGWNMTANDAKLAANTSDAEVTTTEYGNPTATGFEFKGGSASTTYIYMVIRRPNKPPTTGTQVYNVIARTGTGAAATVTGVGFAPDLFWPLRRQVSGKTWFDRLRGPLLTLRSDASGGTNAEVSNADSVTAFLMDGVSLGTDPNLQCNVSGGTYAGQYFRRAPGFFDVVCYTGTGVARTVNHNLGVGPELMIVKKRSGGSTRNWAVFSANLGTSNLLILNLTYEALSTSTSWNTVPTSEVFGCGTDAETNENGGTFIAYLFASLPGISKVGSYTGNGSSQTINCGFSAGARFILIKRTDSAGDWFVWDFARGIVAANDPHLSLNTTAAEVTTDDSVDPNAIGFDVLQNTATNINVLNATYIYLAIA